MACRDVVGFGYGIRYEYGMFRQEIADGWQVEQPDDWLTHSNVWELERPEPAFTIGFGGHVEHRDNGAIWHPAESIIAVAHDLLVPGHRNATVNTLRLWGARPVSGLDLGKFNRGNYLEAIAPKIRSKTVTRLLYPDDSTPEGRELRLRQEHFFASASVQDLIARFLRDHGADWDRLPDKVAIHLNDTHPALAPAELMRLLVDVHQLPWERALELTSSVFSYTNHTLMPEALEVWQADLMRRIAAAPFGDHRGDRPAPGRRAEPCAPTCAPIRSPSSPTATSPSRQHGPLLRADEPQGQRRVGAAQPAGARKPVPRIRQAVPRPLLQRDQRHLSAACGCCQSNPELCRAGRSARWATSGADPLDLTGLQRFADDGEFRAEFCRREAGQQAAARRGDREGDRHHASTRRP